MLVSPRRVLLLVAFLCAAIILGLSAIAAHFVAKWLPTPGSLPAQAGEVAALLWIFLLALTCFASRTIRTFDSLEVSAGRSIPETESLEALEVNAEAGAIIQKSCLKTKFNSNCLATT